MRDPISIALRTAKGYGRRYADGGDAKGDPYTTELDPAETDDFAGWKQQYAPHDSGQDYDLQGAYKAGFTPDPVTGHFDDRFKKPNHPTFSVYSQYAKDRPDLAGTWNGDQYVPPRTQGNPTDDPAAMAYQQLPAPTKPTVMEPDLQTLQTGQMPEGLDTEKYGVDELGRIVDKKTFEPIQLTRRPNVLPFTKTPEGGMEFAMPKIADIAGNMGAGWSVPVQGAEHILGAGLVVPKAVKAAEKKGILDIHPSEVNGWLQEPNSQLGSNPGSMFHDNQGKSWYGKIPSNPDPNPALITERAKNEKLASELYKEVGVPAADVHLTEMDGHTAVMSPIIPGKTLNKYNPDNYGLIKDLHGGFPADAWLANYDSVGTGKDNIVVSNGVAHRIDMGGALRFRAQGKLKDDFGPNVGEFESMTKPGHNGLNNYDAAEVFGQKLTPQQLAAQLATAQRITDVTPERIAELVNLYGPDNSFERTKLYNTIMLRKDQVSKHYGLKPQTENSNNVVPLKPKSQTLDELQAEWEAKLAEPKPNEQAQLEAYEEEQHERIPSSFLKNNDGYSFKDPKKDASTLLSENLYPAQLDEHGQPHKEGGFDTHAIANDMYHMAEKNPEYVDQVFKELPEHIQEDVNAKLSQKIQREGDPWAEPAAPLAAKRDGAAPGGNLKLMELNKTHSVGQLVNAIKPYQKAEINVGKTVTAKQKDKIAEMITSAPNMQIAAAIKKLQPEEVKNILSWLPPAKAANVKHLAKVDPEKASQIIPDIDKVKKGHSLYQMIGAIKNYLPTQSEVPYHAYQSIPKELSKWSPAEIAKEMDNLSLTQKGNVLKWLPESTVEKMVQIGEAQKAKKTFIEQEYYDALKPVNWQSYKPKGATSVRDQIGKKTLKEALAQGYNPDLALFKGGKHHGTYPDEIVDPVTESHKLSNPSERAFFLSDKVVHTEPYGQLGGEYIARPEKVYSVDWQDLTGTEDYAAHHMRRIIEAAREQGADLVIIKGVHDTSGYGHAAQDQYAFLNTHVLRGPKAAFDPDKLHLRHPLAGLVGGGLFSYGMLRGQEDKEQRYARGGTVKVPKPSVNYSKGMQERHCGICQFYHAKTCSKVQGPIDWSFWCRLFKGK